MLQLKIHSKYPIVFFSALEPSPEPGSINVAASVSGVLAIVVAFIIFVICVYKCRNKSTANLPSRSFNNSTGELIPSAVPTSPSAPSTAASRAPTPIPSQPPQHPTTLGPPPSEDGAPPAYDEAMNFPLAAGAGVEPPPPAYNEAI